MNGMQSHEYRGPHTLHERIEELERQVEHLIQQNQRLKEEVIHLDHLLRFK